MLEYERFIGSIRRESLNHLAREKQCPIGSEREVETGRIIGDNPFANRWAKTNAELGRFRYRNRHRQIRVGGYLKFLAQRNPMLGLRSAGRAQLLYAQVRYFSSSAHDPPRRTRYTPVSGPRGFCSVARA